jgi:hypothetical protein
MGDTGDRRKEEQEAASAPVLVAESKSSGRVRNLDVRHAAVRLDEAEAKVRELRLSRHTRAQTRPEWRKLE